MSHVKPETITKWTKTAQGLLLGRTITYIGYDVFSGELFMELDNGTQVTPMSDDEGNGPGSLHVIDKNEKLQILPTL